MPILAYLSPAKSLRFGLPLGEEGLISATQPRLLEQSKLLAQALRAYDVAGIEKLMEVSSKLAQLNASRFLTIDDPMSGSNPNCRTSAFCFNGDAYEAILPESLSWSELSRLNERVRFLSGYYGVLRPFDLMHGYRLEMGRHPAGIGAKSLYDFWGDRISALLAADAKSSKADCTLSLASDEYDKAASVFWASCSNLPLHTSRFESQSLKGRKVVSFDAKRARGLFARHLSMEDFSSMDSAAEKFKFEGWFLSSIGKTNDRGGKLYTFVKNFQD